MFQLRTRAERLLFMKSIHLSPPPHLNPPTSFPPCSGFLVPVFMSGQHISASCTVIILSLHSGSLGAGSSSGHAPPTMFPYFDWLLKGRKAASASHFLLPVVSQQQSNPSSPPSSFSVHLLHGTRRFPFAGPCCFVEESSSEMPQHRVVWFTVQRPPAPSLLNFSHHGALKVKLPVK